MTAGNDNSKRTNRREFFHQLGIGAVGGLFSLLVGIPLVGYFFSVLFNKQEVQWSQVCSLDQINADTPSQFTVSFTRQDAPQAYQEVRSVFVIRRDEEILAFTNICTHMGCSVRWLDWRQQILCPCHGGVYDRWGNLMGGPPAHSLPFYESKIENNILFVANRFQERT